MVTSSNSTRLSSAISYRTRSYKTWIEIKRREIIPQVALVKTIMNMAVGREAIHDIRIIISQPSICRAVAASMEDQIGIRSTLSLRICKTTLATKRGGACKLFKIDVMVKIWILRNCKLSAVRIILKCQAVVLLAMITREATVVNRLELKIRLL